MTLHAKEGRKPILSEVHMTVEDFLAIHDAVLYFNTMGNDADINESLDLLENAGVILGRYRQALDI
jgi:hypothetical protein